MQTTGLSNQGVHPQKFLLWVGMASIVMMFAGLTSAFIVRQAQGGWYEYVIPSIFMVSTILILLSSVTIAIATHAYKKNNRALYRNMMGMTLLLGLAFVYSQYSGFLELRQNGVYLEGNPSGSFFYIIAGAHALHTIGGIFFLLLFSIKSFFKLDSIQKLMHEINPNKFLRVELLATYWHFIGILWVYLYFFLKYYE